VERHNLDGSLVRLRRRLKDDQNGVTGLETAIVLIAFVMVAATFAYVVLSAGIFSSQRAKDLVHAGLQQTGSTVELKGNVLARMVEGIATEACFTVTNIPGADPVDFTNDPETGGTVVISYSDDFQQYPSLDWAVTRLNGSDDDFLLDENELFQIAVDLTAVNESATLEEEMLGPYHSFVLELKPPAGAVLSMELTIPPRFKQFVVLE
jgi:flagellin FlaB